MRNETESTGEEGEREMTADYPMRVWLPCCDGFAYRLDVCKHCGMHYANKRKRGVNYRIHNWFHYATHGECSQCAGPNVPGSMRIEKALEALREGFDKQAYDWQSRQGSRRIRRRS